MNETRYGRKIMNGGITWKSGLALVLMAALVLAAFKSPAQQPKPRPSMKDSLDGGFDMSDYIIEASGFVPVPYIITEPALGGFGVALIPVFIKKNPPYLDSVDGHWVKTPVFPDVTGGLGLYTANNSWALMGFRAGTLIKSRIKYAVGGGYANVNMFFYQTLKQFGETQLKFNIRVFPLLLQATKRIGFSHWYAGIKYVFAKSDVRYTGEDDSVGTLAKALESNTTISALGAIVDLDNRDNPFTPDKGMKFHADGVRSDKFFGSDYDYWRLNYYMIGYMPLVRTLTGGLRVEGQQVFGDLPFYAKPYINMRGIPTMRYQGNATLLAEAEFRWDFVRRWSGVFFSGTGKAFDEWSDFGSSNWEVTYGAGFRYLLARKFKLRMGVDIAHGPGTWAYYIIFGSNWLK
jgi:hypothetical protein